MVDLSVLLTNTDLKLALHGVMIECLDGYLEVISIFTLVSFRLLCLICELIHSMLSMYFSQET